MDKNTKDFLRELNAIYQNVRSVADEIKESVREQTGGRAGAPPAPEYRASPRGNGTAEAPHAAEPPEVHTPPAGHRANSMMPLVNVSEDDEAFWIEAAIPGADPASVDISVAKSRVTISGDRPSTHKAKLHKREYADGPFLRTVDLPVQIDEDQVSAEYEFGILRVRLPRGISVKRVKVEVKG
ncbi:MAG: Hsp20/alpha crystallin family protein [Sumerlaeia bacterium]